MRHPGAGAGEKVNLLPVQLDAMGMPDICTRPAQILGILARTAAELGQGIGDVLVVLGQMGVQHHPLVTRQKRGIAHQLAADRKGRTGRQTHPHHRALGRVVMGINDPDAIFQDRRLALDQTVRRQAAIADPDAHGPARGVKAQTHLAGGGNGVIQPRAIGKQIEMIRGQRAARQGQLCQTHLRADKHLFRPEPGPDRIKPLQPAEQQRILPPRYGAGQGLIQVVVGVDQTRRHHTAARRDHLGPRCLKPAPHGGNHPAPDQHIAPGNLFARAVHGDNRLGLADQDIRHGGSLSCPPLRWIGTTGATEGGRTRRQPHHPSCRKTCRQALQRGLNIHKPPPGTGTTSQGRSHARSHALGDEEKRAARTMSQAFSKAKASAWIARLAAARICPP